MELLPVKYSGQTNAWMTRILFREWFHQDFVRQVQTSLIALGEKPRAILLLDNCSAHPEESELVSDDGEIFAHFLPANVTSLIQPMDQGVLQAVKMKYKKLLRRLIIEDDVGGSIIDFIKSINMKIVVELVAESWNEICSTTIRKSWQKIIPLTSSSGDILNSTLSTLTQIDNLPETLVDSLHEDHCEQPENSAACTPVSTEAKSFFVWRGIRVRFPSQEKEKKLAVSSFKEHSSCDDYESGVTCFKNLFHELGFSLEAEEIIAWLKSDANDSGVQILTDSEICDYVSKSPETHVNSEEEPENSEDLEPSKCPVSHSAAAHMFEQCLTWLEYQPEASVYNTSVLQLHALSASKRMDSMRQSKLSAYFTRKD